MIDQGERVWVEDRGFRVLGPDEHHACTRRGCHAPAVAVMYRTAHNYRRSPPRAYGRRWFCCPEHLYGGRIEGGRVLCEVAVGSPAARRGYVD